MNRTELRIFLFWLTLILVLRLSLFLPHGYLDGIRLINTWLQLLLFLLALFIAIKSTGKKKFIYYNISLYFGFVVFLFFSSFVGKSFFADNKYSSFFYYVYINFMATGFVTFLVIFFVFVDYLLGTMKQWNKYLVSACASFTLIFLLFNPYMFKPFELYNGLGYQTYQHLSVEWGRLRASGNDDAGKEGLILGARLSSEIPPDIKNEIANNIDEYFNPVKSGDFTTIFWKPLSERMFFLNFSVVVLLSVFLAIIYMKDKPYYPYMDKLMVTFMLFFAVETLHSFASTNISIIYLYRIVVTVGQYISVGIFLLFVFLFHLNLRFVMSPVSAFYEEALLKSPTRVTRWRDEIDTFILNSFARYLPLAGRIAQTENMNRKDRLS